MKTKNKVSDEELQLFLKDAVNQLNTFDIKEKDDCFLLYLKDTDHIVATLSKDSLQEAYQQTQDSAE